MLSFAWNPISAFSIVENIDVLMNQDLFFLIVATRYDLY